ncbi:PTS sugar transporter subunit IIA [Pseudohaliea rubra]|uniref:PTS IIA-like nitrogen-regulatory protein PtsN n=1 Tax=Pseudohaliea rubra DSM 19751 TaxID=1265313 RepID=A0A095VP23_9GAMM|nr:PTS sugar transporter subunit IIA [Pseudohaliea rubra]KGE03222.1 PTS IIA-like nitrogen-regulatory protein PtsN [Pseudohaliea rubra DSM 19751]
METLKELLSPARTQRGVKGTSKKAIFEEVAALVAADHPELDVGDLIGKLLAREKLGSTGLGGGVAIPHCRLANCAEPLGALVTLGEPADFDAPDDTPVDLLVVLVVPEEAHQDHLDILASIARLFSQAPLRAALRACESNRALYDTVVGWDG